MAATWSICPAKNVSLATSAGTISGNFQLIQDSLGLGTLANGVSWVQGDIVYTSSDTRLQRLAKASTAYQVLTSGGTSQNPSYGLLNVSSMVTGILQISKGGTGSSTSSHTDLAANVYGTLPVGRGGTGATAAANAANGVAVVGGDGYLANDLVDTTALKTATGEVSQAQASSWYKLTLPGGIYGFVPQIKCSTATSNTAATVGGGGQIDTITYSTSYETIGTVYPATGTIYFNQTYVTASGQDHWIFILVDKITKEIIAAYQAPDHPAYGNGGDFEKMPHPFIFQYDETKHEIILLDKETCNQLKNEATEEKSILTLVNEEYKPNLLKEEVYVPLHSGKFLGQKQVMVDTIPSYIKIRKLKKLSSVEKKTKKDNQEAKRMLVEQELKTQKQKKLSALAKIKQVANLTDEELEAIK